MDLNSDLYSIHTGEVVTVNDGIDPGEPGYGGFGNNIVVAASLVGETVHITYAHLNRVDVQVGDIVQMGDKVGLSGNTGNANNSRSSLEILPHVHIEAHTDGGATRVDPGPYMATQFQDNGEVKTTCD